MTDTLHPVISEFVSALDPKVRGNLRGTARLDIAESGSVWLDSTGAQPGDGAADVVLIATETVFRAIMDGSQNPMRAYMMGKLKVEGSPMRALKVSEILIG